MQAFITTEQKTDLHMDIDIRMAKIRKLLGKPQGLLPVLPQTPGRDSFDSAALDKEVASFGGDVQALAMAMAAQAIRQIHTFECLWYRATEFHRLMAEIHDNCQRPLMAAEERAKADVLDAEKARRIKDNLPMCNT